jgi:hypothetical protein
LISPSTLTIAFAGKYGTTGTLDLKIVIPYSADGEKEVGMQGKN